MPPVFSREHVIRAAERVFNAIWEKREKAIAEFKTFSRYKQFWLNEFSFKGQSLFQRETQDQRQLEIVTRLIFKGKADFYQLEVIPLSDQEIDAIIQYWEDPRS
jgi:hypothetical protein